MNIQRPRISLVHFISCVLWEMSSEVYIQCDITAEFPYSINSVVLSTIQMNSISVKYLKHFYMLPK